MRPEFSNEACRDRQRTADAGDRARRSRPRRPRVARPAGFTLLELLVVIATIAVLAGLLLPGLRRAKEQAQGVACLNNLKQLQLAWHLYADDTADWLPPNYAGWEGGHDPRWPVWVASWLTYDFHSPYPEEYTNAGTLLAPGQGRIGPYLGAAATFHCPGDTSKAWVKGAWYARPRSYSMNGFMGWRPPLIEEDTWYFYRRRSDIVAPPPSRLWAFIDEHPDSLDDAMFAIVAEQWPYAEMHWTSLPASRHNGAGALSFADGHVERKRWVDRRTRQPVTGVQRPFVLASNSVDVVWVQQRTTARTPGFVPW